VVGQICYRLDPEQHFKSVCKESDLVDAYAWAGGPIYDKVLSATDPQWQPAIRWYKVIGAPLYSIGSMKDVTALMEQVRAAKTASANQGGQS
jgi:hypothetical protein